MDIAWHPRGPADDALRAHLPTPVTIGRHCPTCGSTTHGRPWVRLPDGTSPHVSLSRCGEHLVTVIADDPVGIDVESIAAVDARWDPALVLHPDEVPHDLKEMRELAHDLKEMRQQAAMWCRKEAILKALGTGLATPMSEIRVADWQVVDIEAPEGLAAAVATIPQTGRRGSSTS